jgi:pSer/pThr/pTyr-binding forkhead associated (FHA) protein
VFLRNAVKEKLKLIATQLLSILEILGDSSEAMNIARSTGVLASNVISEILQSDSEAFSWNKRLAPRIISVLQQSVQLTDSIELSTNIGSTTAPFDQALTSANRGQLTTQLIGKQISSKEALNDVLLKLVQDIDPLVQSASLYALQQSDPTIAFQQAQQLLDSKQNKDWLLQETAEKILGINHNQTQGEKVPTLITQIRVMGKTQTRTFQQATIQVGRGHDNDIVILDNRVSREHAIFYLDDKGVSVKDLDSSNGLRIGKEYIQNQQKQLKSGDFVRFSSGDDLVIHIQWELRPVQAHTVTESVPTLLKLFWIYNSGFFKQLNAKALVELARNASVRVYRPQEEICKIGTLARELIIMVDGEATVSPTDANQPQTILSGQTIGELEVLTHSNYAATVMAGGVSTKVLAIGAQDFERMLSTDPLLARNLLEVVTHRLQQNLGQAYMTQI